MFPCTSVNMWASLLYLCVHPSHHGLYRLCILISTPLMSLSDVKNSTNRSCSSKQLSTGFAFKNTDSNDVTWGGSLTVNVSLIVGFWNLSNVFMTQISARELGSRFDHVCLSSIHLHSSTLRFVDNHQLLSYSQYAQYLFMPRLLQPYHLCAYNSVGYSS